MKTVLAWIAGIIAFFATIFALNVWGMVNMEFFGKWRENVRHEIHKESTAHRDGMQRNLSALLNDYNAATSNAQKIGIIATVKHQYSQEDTSTYPAYLQDFLGVAGIY